MRQKQGVQQELLRADTPPGGQAAISDDGAVIQTPASVTSGGAQTQYEFESVNRDESFMGTCPDCGSQMEQAEGCAKCHVCGYSECG